MSPPEPKSPSPMEVEEVREEIHDLAVKNAQALKDLERFRAKVEEAMPAGSITTLKSRKYAHKPFSKPYYDHHDAHNEMMATHAPHQAGAYPDVYVNDEDVTVTVDPVGNAHWIRDDTMRHAASVHRGALKNHAGVMHALDVIKHQGDSRETFIPTSSMLDRLPKLSSCRTRCALEVRDGTLPVIHERVWKNTLPNNPYILDDLRLENGHLSRNRAFDCSGWCR